MIGSKAWWLKSIDMASSPRKRLLVQRSLLVIEPRLKPLESFGSKLTKPKVSLASELLWINNCNVQSVAMCAKIRISSCIISIISSAPSVQQHNWDKRSQRADLTGRTALVTGGRIKIGYQTALKLLRDGATVLITTRFSHDAAQRFAAEPDFDTWRDRLQIFALDLRNVPAVELFAQQLNRDLSSLDIIVHNAAQTVKRPLDFYQHLLDAQQNPAATDLICNDHSQPVLMEAWPKYRGHLPAVGDYFPPQCLDRDGQQVDLRPEHSWLLKIGEVETVEMLEVFLVNAAAPFTLTNRLKPLLLNAPFQRRFVINVSAMEGQFGRKNKTAFHPHTNMAKAALNMLTRTSAEDLASQGIFMNSVDTGWITDEKPVPLAKKVQEEHGFYPPLDIIDGAARVYDPIAVGCNEDATPLFGHFLKDYFPHPW